jgi:Methyltransferase small domain
MRQDFKIAINGAFDREIRGASAQLGRIRRLPQGGENSVGESGVIADRHEPPVAPASTLAWTARAGDVTAKNTPRWLELTGEPCAEDHAAPLRVLRRTARAGSGDAVRRDLPPQNAFRLDRSAATEQTLVRRPSPNGESSIDELASMGHILRHLIRPVYDSYAASRSSPVRRIRRRLVTSPRIVAALFGIKVLSTHGIGYFDLTTVLLRQVLKERLRNAHDTKLLEVGVGAFAVLSGALARWVEGPIDAFDVEAALVESSRRHVELNRINVNVFQSNLFERVPKVKYDLIFWNLPYYRDPNLYLSSLFEQAPDFMHNYSELIIGYNTKPLPRVTIERILDGYPSLQIKRVVTWWWNMHEVLVLHTPGRRPAA